MPPKCRNYQRSLAPNPAAAHVSTQMRWCRLIAENYFPFQSRSEKKAHLPTHTNIAQTPSGGVKTPLTVHVGETDEQHSWNSGTCDGRQRERERERDDCVLVNKKLHADAACFRLCFDQLSVMQKQKRTTYSEHQEYFYFYFCSCYAIKAKRVKLEISIRFNSLSQALNAAFLCICHIRK